MIVGAVFLSKHNDQVLAVLMRYVG